VLFNKEEKTVLHLPLVIVIVLLIVGKRRVWATRGSTQEGYRGWTSASGEWSQGTWETEGTSWTEGHSEKTCTGEDWTAEEIRTWS